MARASPPNNKFLKWGELHKLVVQGDAGGEDVEAGNTSMFVTLGLNLLRQLPRYRQVACGLHEARPS